MQLVHTIADLRACLAGAECPAFVPTMGNLHEGHLSLLRQAKGLGDVSVASIFVNRLQFLPHEDFDSYPRTWESDCDKLRSAGCDVLFAPREPDLYPQAQTYKVHADPALADLLEGHFRPGFFTGVCTVVMKLFMAVFAGKVKGVAVFGKKDYQQLMVIGQMVQQFALPIEVFAGETARAPDGLVLSSRNGYLTAEQRAQAVQLSMALRDLGRAALASADAMPQHLAKLEADAMRALGQLGWQPDYLCVRNRSQLQTPKVGEPLVVLGAARLGSTRLIDNLEIN